MNAFRATVGAVLAAALLAGCQTARKPDPGSTIHVAGNYAALAACYAATQPAAVSQTKVARTGFRSVLVTSSSPSRAAAALTNAPDAELASAYIVTFTEAVGYATDVSGSTVGPAVAPFFWQNVVMPQLRNCTGNPTLS